MKSAFKRPSCEFVRFTKKDIVTTSDCCDVEGMQFDDDDYVCEVGDGCCNCPSNSQGVNCT